MIYTLKGVFDKAKAGHDESYYAQRDTFLDLRGNARISPLSYWGWGCKVITQSHNISAGEFTPYVVNKAVIVDDHAWITSFAILYNCHVKHHGIIAIGSVVSGMTVEPFTIVAGNPARVVAEWSGERWVKV